MDPHNLVVLPSTDGHYIFDQAHLDQMVAQTLPSVPEKNTLMWAVGTDIKGATAAVVFTREVGKVDWQAKAAVSWTPTGGVDAAASVGGTIHFE